MARVVAHEISSVSLKLTFYPAWLQNHVQSNRYAWCDSCRSSVQGRGGGFSARFFLDQNIEELAFKFFVWQRSPASSLLEARPETLGCAGLLHSSIPAA